MQRIYSNSCLTICATNSSACTIGFLQEHGGVKDEVCRGFSIPYRCANSESGRIVVQDYESRITDEPVWKRAWTMQERLLSPRTLTFTTKAIYWECKSVSYHLDSERCGSGPGFQTQHFEPRNKNELTIWTTLVEEYTGRASTRPKDRLLAVAGLAARCQGSFWGMVYRAGLWHGNGPYGKDWLIAQLLWLETGFTRSRKRLPVDGLAPSWPWASVETAVEWEPEDVVPSLGPDDPAEVIECVAEPIYKNDPYGQCKNGFVAIRSRFRTIKVQLNASRRGNCLVPCLEGAGGTTFVEDDIKLDPGILNLSPTGFIHSTYDDDDDGWIHGGVQQFDGKREIEISFLQLREASGLVLWWVGDMTYKRVGRFHIRHGGRDLNNLYMEWSPPPTYSSHLGDYQSRLRTFFGGTVETVSIIRLLKHSPNYRVGVRLQKLVYMRLIPKTTQTVTAASLRPMSTQPPKALNFGQTTMAFYLPSEQYYPGHWYPDYMLDAHSFPSTIK